MEGTTFGCKSRALNRTNVWYLNSWIISRKESPRMVSTVPITKPPSKLTKILVVLRLIAVETDNEAFAEFLKSQVREDSNDGKVQKHPPSKYQHPRSSCVEFHISLRSSNPHPNHVWALPPVHVTYRCANHADVTTDNFSLNCPTLCGLSVTTTTAFCTVDLVTSGGL